MTTLQAAPVAPPRPVRTGAVLAVLLTAQLMAILDTNIVNVAGATIRSDLHTSGAGMQLVIAGYTIAYAVLLITGARVGGMIGYRRAFLLGLAGFTAASLACGLAGTSGQLIAFRLVQGAGAALMIPQVFSLIQRNFTGPTRARALGYYAAVISGGVVAGQVLGGILVDADLWGTGWRPVFIINVPIGLAVLVLGRRLLPGDTREPARPLDLAGLVTLAATVLAFVTPLVLGHEEGWPAWCWLSLGASVLLFGGFVVVQRRAAAPLMPGRVFRAPGMLVALTALVAMMVSYASYTFTVTLHLQTAAGYSPLQAGLTFAPMAVCFGIASLNWRRLPQRWHRPAIPVGLLVAAGSLAVIAFAMRGASPVGPLFLAAQIPFGFGSGVAFSPLMAKALAGVRPADAADASGLLTTNVQLSQVLGVAGLGSLYLGLTESSAGPTAAGHAIMITLVVEAAAALLGAAVSLLLPRPPAAPR
jgi:EmrB/QacA subfamily drug resistance transporter